MHSRRNQNEYISDENHDCLPAALPRHRHVARGNVPAGLLTQHLSHNSVHVALSEQDRLRSRCRWHKAHNRHTCVANIILNLPEQALECPHCIMLCI